MKGIIKTSIKKINREAVRPKKESSQVSYDVFMCSCVHVFMCRRIKKHCKQAAASRQFVHHTLYRFWLKKSI
jgi:hypothetical protein